MTRWFYRAPCRSSLRPTVARAVSIRFGSRTSLQQIAYRVIHRFGDSAYTDQALRCLHRDGR